MCVGWCGGVGWEGGVVLLAIGTLVASHFSRYYWFLLLQVGVLPVLRVILVSPVRVLPVPKAVSLMQATPHKQTCSPELSSLFTSFLVLQLIRQCFCPPWKDSLTRTRQTNYKVHSLLYTNTLFIVWAEIPIVLSEKESCYKYEPC